MNHLNFWIAFGFFGQFIFFLRFVVQWWASEKAKAVIIPKIFWHLSLLGTLIIFIYSIYRQDVVFSIASFLNFFIYLRNLYLTE